MQQSRIVPILMIALGSVLAIAAAIILYLVLFGNAQPEPTAPTANENPFSTIGSGTRTPVEGESLALTLNDGRSVSVPNFTTEEQPVWVSTYEYQVTGSPYESFLITYLEPDQDNPNGEFLVTLLSEPLGETRRAAQAALRARLSLSDAELCLLDAAVTAGPGVNDAYPPDYELGLESCPRAVVLP